MKRPSIPSIGSAEAWTMALVFACTLALRTWGVGTRFLLLRDQIRDWGIALGPFSDIPLVGPATHVGGYTVGPAFYWILWVIRVVIGPWFDNLPHAGGIGQAMMQSFADALLLLALWRRTGSLSIALATIVIVASAAFDLSLSALVWNPVMGSTLAKMALALVLLDWHRGTAGRAAIAAGVAWIAVQAYTGAIFVAVGVFAAMVADPWLRGERQSAWRNGSIVVLVVAALQVPYLVHQITNGFRSSGMSAVVESVTRVVAGADAPEVAKSVEGYEGAFDAIQIAPWHFSYTRWILLACALVMAIRYRRDRALLIVTLLPAVAAIVGYSLFLAALDHYYYLSLMPAAVFSVVAAATALPWKPLARVLGIVLVVGSLALVPSRREWAMQIHQMPEYGAIVRASRVIAGRGIPMRAVRLDFKLPPTNDPEFVYEILGGRLDRSSPWVAVISRDGDVTYRNVGGT